MNDDALKLYGCAEAEDKGEGDANKYTDEIERSGESIFLGFESEMHEENVEEPEPEVDESEQSITSKSAEPSVVTVESYLGPAIEHLWSFQCPMTKGYNVTSLDWNKTNQVCHPFIARRYASAVYAVVVCLCVYVCHTPVLCQNG